MHRRANTRTVRLDYRELRMQESEGKHHKPKAESGHRERKGAKRRSNLNSAGKSKCLRSFISILFIFVVQGLRMKRGEALKSIRLRRRITQAKKSVLEIIKGGRVLFFNKTYSL